MFEKLCKEAHIHIWTRNILLLCYEGLSRRWVTNDVMGPVMGSKRFDDGWISFVPSVWFVLGARRLWKICGWCYSVRSSCWFSISTDDVLHNETCVAIASLCWMKHRQNSDWELDLPWFSYGYWNPLCCCLTMLLPMMLWLLPPVNPK